MGARVCFCLLLGAPLLAALPWSAEARAQSQDLVSHRAIYTMTLKSATQASDIADLNGQMFIEVADVCDGWTLEQRIALTIADFDGGVVHTYTSFVSWESKDGHRFSFEQQTRQDGI